MTGSSAPPPSAPPPNAPVRAFELAPAGRLKRLLSGSGIHRLTVGPDEIVVEHAHKLRAPLRFPTGSVVVAATDPGPASVGKEGVRGRFAVLHRLGTTQVVPKSEGIEGWLWTSVDGTAMTILADDAPNVAFVFSPPLSGHVVEQAFEPAMLDELAKRSPLGEPAVFCLLLRAQYVDELRKHFERLGLGEIVTDREVPPVQRRHLPEDKPANPAVARRQASSRTSVPPPSTKQA